MSFKDLDELYSFLSENYGLIKYKDLTEDYARNMYKPFIQKKYTTAYLVFCVNIYRTLSIYRVLLEGYSSLRSKEFFVGQFERNAPNETVMILLITNIEVYLRMGFMNIASVCTKDTVDCNYISQFLRKFRINNSDKINKFICTKIKLNELMPPLDQLMFQQNELCSIAYKLCNIEIPQIEVELWRRLFSGEEDGYIKLRNNLIHKGFQSSIQYEIILCREFIEQVILDIVKLAFKIDLTVVNKYPGASFPQLYMK